MRIADVDRAGRENADFERLRDFLLDVQKPGQYVGAEWNSAHKDPRALAVRCALVFPDTYAIGMSCLGYKVVHHLFNRREDAAAERFFLPEPDMERILREEGIPLLSLESHTPLREFPLVAFSLQYELLLTNVLAALDLGSLPLLARDRTEDDPIVVAGGSGTLSPEPAAPFFDLLLTGDGEAVVDPLVETFREANEAGLPRHERIRALARAVPGAFAPSLYTRTASPSGVLLPRPRPGTDAPERIRPALQADLDSAPFPVSPPVPGVEVPHDRIALEIMRGCPHSCRFCQAGSTRKPVRFRSREVLLDLAEASYRATGYDEITLLSLSSNDYPDLPGLVEAVHRRFEGRAVNISLPSLRVDEGLARLPHVLSAVRRSGLTLAPEAGCGLRGTINKPVRDEDLLAGALRAWEEGWRLIKLYFMVGLPGEGDEDLDQIASLSEGVARSRGRVRESAGRVNVTVSPFVPRPHTPFQWEAQEAPGRVRASFDRILAKARLKSVRYKFHSPERAVLEGVLCRGDERAARAVLRAYLAGARFDAWDDRFRFDLWEDAFQREGIDLESALFRPRDPGEEAPWEIIEAGPPRRVLLLEREKALQGRTTPSCGPGACPGSCGKPRSACDLAEQEKA